MATAAREGRHIPELLWNLVLATARQHSVHRTATITGVGYYEVKKRLAATAASSAPQSLVDSPFVELSPPPAMSSAVSSTTPTSECLLEWKSQGYAVIVAPRLSKRWPMTVKEFGSSRSELAKVTFVGGTVMSRNPARIKPRRRE